MKIDLNERDGNKECGQEHNNHREEQSEGDAVCAVPDTFHHLMIIHVIGPSEKARQRERHSYRQRNKLRRPGSEKDIPTGREIS